MAQQQQDPYDEHQKAARAKIFAFLKGRGLNPVVSDGNIWFDGNSRVIWVSPDRNPLFIEYAGAMFRVGDDGYEFYKAITAVRKANNAVSGARIRLDEFRIVCSSDVFVLKVEDFIAMFDTLTKAVDKASFEFIQYYENPGRDRL